MKADDVLESLRRIPRPHLSSFFAARVAALATPEAPRRSSRLMPLYWVVLAAAGGPLLLTSWQRVTLVVAVAVAMRGLVALTPAGGRSR